MNHIGYRSQRRKSSFGPPSPRCIGRHAQLVGEGDEFDSAKRFDVTSTLKAVRRLRSMLLLFLGERAPSFRAAVNL